MKDLQLLNNQITIESIVDSVVNGIEEGFTDPIEVAAQLKRLEDLHKTLKAKTSSYIVDELYTAGTTEKLGYKVEKFTTGERLDYSSNEDWIAIENAKKELSERQKPIEAKMKAAYKNGCSFVDDETGEVVAPAKHKSGGQDSFKVTKLK